MNSMTFALSLICSLSVSQAFAQFDEVSTAKTTQDIIKQSGRSPYLHSIDIQAILREVSRQEEMFAQNSPQSKAIPPVKEKKFELVLTSMDDLAEHTVEEVALALKVAGYDEDAALTVHMRQEMAEAKQDLARNRTRRAMKIELQKYVAAIRENLGFPVQTSGGSQDEVAVDGKSYSIADRVLDTVRIDKDKVRIEFYSSSGINGNRDISMIKRVGEKAYLEIRSNRNYDKKVYYGAGADIGRSNDQGRRISQVVFYIGGKFDANFQLRK